MRAARRRKPVQTSERSAAGAGVSRTSSSSDSEELSPPSKGFATPDGARPP